MQGMVMGMNHLTTGLGALFGSAFYNVVAVVTDTAGNLHSQRDLYTPQLITVEQARSQL